MELTPKEKTKKKQESIFAYISLSVFVLFIILFGYFGTTPRTQPTQQEMITPEKLQTAVQEMAQFMVKDDNRIGLKMWAKALGQSAHDFESAASLYAKIRQASNDFSVYKNPQEVSSLIQLLGNQDMIFDEVILESLKK
jgi:hypothetical protein